MTVLPIIAALFIAQGQTAGPSPTELAAMKKLDFLVGIWKGTGESTIGPGQTHKFTGGEVVQSKLQGKAILVEGFVKDVEGKPAHETLAVITFDEKIEKYKFKTYLFNRPEGEHELHVEDKGFWWEMIVPNAPVIRFTMKLTDKGEWNEIGELRSPGRTPFKFFEMTLTKGE